jgi:cell volume regulation protein A
VEVAELRLPAGATVTMVFRRGEIFAPEPTTVLRRGDHVVIAGARDDRARIERRLRQVSESGRLAGWYDGIVAPR